MRVFLDANVLVSVLNKEYPLYSDSARILSLSQDRRYSLYTSPVCLAIAFYFAEKKSGARTAKNKIEILVKNIGVTDAGKDTVLASLKDPKVNDFEDGLEYYSAVKAKCNVIVTEDTDDFYFSKMGVLNCRDFAKKYFK